MGIPASAAHVIVRGHLGGGEQFAYGFWFQTIGGMTQAILDNLRVTFSQAYTSALQPTQLACLAPDCGLDSITAYGYTGGATAAFTSAETRNQVGTTASKVLPLQTSCVASLRTGRPGRSFRGRAYLPVLTKTLAQYQFQNADVDVIANGVANMLSTVNDATGTGGFNRAIPVVMSSKQGLLTPITSVTVDSKPDVQRRRARSEVVAYTKVTALT